MRGERGRPRSIPWAALTIRTILGPTLLHLQLRVQLRQQAWSRRYNCERAYDWSRLAYLKYAHTRVSVYMHNLKRVHTDALCVVLKYVRAHVVLRIIVHMHMPILTPIPIPIPMPTHMHMPMPMNCTCVCSCTCTCRFIIWMSADDSALS